MLKESPSAAAAWFRNRKKNEHLQEIKFLTFTKKNKLTVEISVVSLTSFQLFAQNND